jgi:histidinol-phosphatase (PHP family)
MRADYHVHSEFSSDCDAPLTSIFERAVELGLDGLAVTDHLDPGFPRNDGTFELDLPGYLRVLTGYRNTGWKGLEIRTGIELGLQPTMADEIRSVMARNELDFVIGSQHCVGGCEFFDDSFFIGKRKEQAHREYFEELYRNLEMFEGISVIGHMDFFRRYGRSVYGREHMIVDYDAHMDIIDAILKLAVERGVGLELNTSANRLGLGHFHPDPVILRHYLILGGEILTLGSDCHDPSEIAWCFDGCMDLLKDIGFRYVCSFNGCRPEFHPIR